MKTLILFFLLTVVAFGQSVTVGVDSLTYGDTTSTYNFYHDYKDVYCTVQDTGSGVVDSLVFEEYNYALTTWVQIGAYNMYAPLTVVTAIVPGAAATKTFLLGKSHPGLVRIRRTNTAVLSRVTWLQFLGVK